MNKKDLIKFISEIYMLKRNKHEGFRLAGVDNPDSLAEHIAISAQLAYIIGELEGLNGERCATIALFHDNGEARISDQHKVAARYINNHQAELDAISEQVKFLPKDIAKKIVSFYNQTEVRDTPEGVVAKDADWVEVALQAKIYSEQGYKTDSWIENVTDSVETKTAKMIMAEISKIDDFTNTWYEGLKKMTHEKII